MNSFQDKFLALRQEYPVFVYRSFACRQEGDSLALSFHFALCDAQGGERHSFRPRLSFPARDFYHGIPEAELRKLVFHCGMVELISYWKCACSPLVRMECAELEAAQLEWFKKLYFHGLGEFFYLNGIQTGQEDFMRMECCPRKDGRLLYIQGILAEDGKVEGEGTGRDKTGILPETEGILVPVGGGKDSVVSLEILRKRHAGKIRPLVINPRGATRTCCIQAGFEEEDCVVVERSIDSHLLELNAQGYLNGHTPFSAMLAFVSLLASALTGYRRIALSNENSANESTVAGLEVNHQYSKSFEFESDFRDYVRRYIGSDYDYFSFLRPLNEIGIARLFSSFPLYHSIFRSCNAGSKTDSWCGKCPKCLFAFIILCPFLGIGKTSRIFGKNLLDDPSLETFLDELCGRLPVKPFECVGTVEEVNWSLQQLRPFTARNALLAYYSGLPESEVQVSGSVLENFSSQHHVPEDLLEDLRAAVEEVRGRCRGNSGNGTGFESSAEGAYRVENPLPEAVKAAFRPFFEGVLPVALVGLGREGLSSYRFIRRLLPDKELVLVDRSEAVCRNPVFAGDAHVRFLTGESYLEDLAAQAGSFGLIMKTPGVSFKDYPALLASPALSSQADLFLRVYAPQVIGITGTKGKSTTSLLTHHLIRVSRPCLLAGNMGLPFFEILEEIGPRTWIVCELSAHQLEQVRRAPRVGVLLNLYEEHLDHYRSYEDYQRAKMRVLGNGDDDNVLVYNCDEPLVRKRMAERFPGLEPGEGCMPQDKAFGNTGKRQTVSCSCRGEGVRLGGKRGGQKCFQTFSLVEPADLYREGRWILAKGGKPVFDLSRPHPLIGDHNVLNLMAALLAAHATGLPYEVLTGRIASFEPLPHRLQYIGCVGGIHYFNDSISTIPQAAVAAVESVSRLPYVQGVDTLIVGGFDRGIDYTALETFLARGKVRNVAFTGRAGRRVWEELAGILEKDGSGQGKVAETGMMGRLPDAAGKIILENYLLSDDYEEIVAWCKQVTRPGYACVLSPAAASYDRFKDFAQRGEVFMALVRQP